jgi:hypothetical protein
MGDARDVLVIATDDEFWRLHTDCGVACQCARTTAGARYLAFYRISPISAVTHYSRVVREERDADLRVTLKRSPWLMPRAEREGWLRQRHIRYTLADLVELPRPVRKAADERPIRSKKWTILDRLCRARTLGDL